MILLLCSWMIGQYMHAVHEILDSQRRRGHLKYFVDWEGYRPEERSWVARGLTSSIPILLSTFHASHPTCPAPCGWALPQCWWLCPSEAACGGGDLSQSHRAPPLPSHSAYSFPHSDCTHLFINYLLFMDSIETLHTHSLSALVVVCPKTVQTPLLILPVRYAWIAPSSAPLCFLPSGFLVCLSYLPTKTVIIKLGVVIVSSIIYTNLHCLYSHAVEFIFCLCLQ